MNNAFPDTSSIRSLAATLLLCVAALAACQPPLGVMAPAGKVAVPAAATMPAPQEPFDATPITPVESAGASAG